MSICPLCSREFKQITAQHIRTHDISVEEFKNSFPDIVLCNINAIKASKDAALKRAEIDNIRCKQCNTLITAFDRKTKTFCSHSCSASYYNNKREQIEKICPICNKQLTVKQSYVNGACCSKQCSSEYSYKQIVEQWLNGEINGSGNNRNHTIRIFVRRYLTEKNNGKCEKCGWSETNTYTGLIPMHIHHKDGDSTNSTLSNLEFLCPNCHSLTGNYGGRNKGNSTRK